jgi:hypothetical protein
MGAARAVSADECLPPLVARWVAPMWSAAVLEPALPGRSTIASGSPAPWAVVGPGRNRVESLSELIEARLLGR